MTDKNVKYDGSSLGTSLSLLERARGNDDAAWERLVSLYTPLVFQWCLKLGLQPHDAENVGQEVFETVARKLKDFRHDRADDTFRGWLRVITRNKFTDHLRQIKSEPSGQGGDDALEILKSISTECDDAVASDEIALLYRQAVDLIRGQFSDRDWRAFYRVVVDGMQAKDVAAELNVTVNIVYLAKSNILKFVREEFRDVIDGNPESLRSP